MRKTPLHRVSAKTRARNLLWHKITEKRMFYLEEKYGATICEYCGKLGYPFQDSVWGLWGHHIDGDRNNLDKENCYIAHNAPCHQVITDENTQTSQEDFQGANK